MATELLERFFDENPTLVTRPKQVPSVPPIILEIQSIVEWTPVTRLAVRSTVIVRGRIRG